MKPLNAVIRAALVNPYLPLVTAIGIAALGVISLRRIPADLLPIFETPAVQIVTFYPGMPAEVMERDIMSRLERWTGQSVGIEHQEAKAMLGVCVVKDFFHEEVSLDTAMSQVTSYAMSDLFYLPPGTIPPMVMPFDPTAMTPLCLLSVSSDTLDEKELYDIAYFELRNRLQSISGVIAPAVYGGVLRRILAYVDRDRLESRGMDPLDVVEALGRWNTLIPTGNAKLGPIDYQLQANGMVRRPEELNDVPILFRDGRPIYLRDVGSVEDSHQIQTNVVRVDGKRQVYIPIYRQPGANSLKIVQGVKDQIEAIRTRLPRGVRLDVVFDQSVTIRRAIGELRTAALIGLGLAAAIVVFFLRRFLPSLAVIGTVILAVAAAVFGLERSGQSVNVMTLGGLALAVGVMVDQAIVLMENILRHSERGKPALQAAWDGAREVAAPVLVSTVTFIAVFFPVVFLSGMAKFLFVPLALAVTFGMLASYVLAILVIPAFAGYVGVRSGSQGKDLHGRRPGVFERFEEAYARLARALVRRPLWVVLAAFALLVSAGVIYPHLGQELFPRLDQGQFTIFVRAPSGTRIERTEALIAEIERAIAEEVSARPGSLAFARAASGAAEPLRYPPQSEVRTIISNIGVLMDWPAAYTWNSGPMDAFVLVQLKEDRTRTSLEHVEHLRRVLPERFPGVEFSFDTAGMLTSALNFGLPAPINVRVEGTKGYARAHEIAKVLRNDIARTIPGAVDVRIQQKLDYPQIRIDIDREKAAYYGLTQEEIVQNIVTATNSSINFKPAFWIDEQNGNHYFIGAQYREDAIESLETLQTLPINSPRRNRPVQLKDLAGFTLTTAPAEITHLNITRMIDIYVNVAHGYDVGTVSRAVDDLIRRRLEESAALREELRLAEVRRKRAEKAGDAEAARNARADAERLRASILIPEGFRVFQAGEFTSFLGSLGEFIFGFLLAAVLAYLILVLLFRSLREPLVILFAVPLGLVGVIWMLEITGTTLNIQSAMGTILMTGLVVEYGILLVEFANRLRVRGFAVEEAVVEAARTRLRPILMTSLTTALALVPMAFFGPRGGGANAALARTILGGVTAAAVLTLLVLPALYRLLARPRLGEPPVLDERPAGST